MKKNNIIATKEEMLKKAAQEARGLAIDAVSSAKSGHLGLPLGAAEIGAVLFGQLLHYNPDEPRWLNRDRFVLSAGHGSMFLYAWLHLAGYDLSLDEIRHFRQLNSKTPGHPEFRMTPGVECTTGPLGQGIGNAVGMAISARMMAARYNTSCQLFDYSVVCLCGDGCLQEGVAQEAIAFAGHLGLDNLILIYDSNGVTLDAMADKTQSGNVVKRFESYGFDVQQVDGHDMVAIAKAYESAKNAKNQKPHLIIATTVIGKGIAEVEGTAKAHGEGGFKFADAARRSLGLPSEKFFVSQEVRNFFEGHRFNLLSTYTKWKDMFAQWSKANPSLAQELSSTLPPPPPYDLLNKIPCFTEETLSTRVAGEKVLNALASFDPLIISGSADLHSSTKNYIHNGGDIFKNSFSGKNLCFGIREHAMGAILNGFAYEGIFKPSGATFLVFSDYLRPSIRLAALSHLPVVYIFTHDSIGVGEDGPTHQPIETISALRCIPNLHVIRPADCEETVGAFIAAMDRMSGPTALILTRQNIPNLHTINADTRRHSVAKGAYVAKKEKGELKLILMASGSEVHLALKVAEELDDNVRVVSMPSMELFDRQSDSYKQQILPSSCKNRISIEAGRTSLWHKYVGLEGVVMGIDKFGISAPAELIFQSYGLTMDNILKEAKNFL